MEDEILIEVEEDNELDSIPAPLTNALRPDFESFQAQGLHDYLTGLKKVSPEEFYRDVFPAGALADAEAQEQGKFACRIYREGEYPQYVNDDLKEVLKCTPEHAAQMSCIAYAGRGESPEQASELYALILKVLLPEEISYKYAESCLSRLEEVVDQYGNYHQRTPRICPTYMLTDPSYEAVYFCYVFRDFVPMYHHMHIKLQRLYDALSRAIHHLWDIGIWDDIQKKFVYKYECIKPLPGSIFQRYPVVGSKYGEGEFTAYKTGQKYDLDELNVLVPKTCQAFLYDTKMTMEEAKEQFSDWHTRRVVEKRKPSKSPIYKDKTLLYKWFFRTAFEQKGNITLGAMEALAACAAKGFIEPDVLSEDLADLHTILSARFSEDDIIVHERRAKELYDIDPSVLRHWTFDDIIEQSGLQHKRYDRKGNTQKQHMKILQEKNEEKSRKDAVIAWFEDNPDGTQAQCARELGVSRKTVSKWVAVKEKAEKRKNLCPHCGTPMVKTKIEPYFWSLKAKFYSRIDKDCPNCQHHIKGKAYVCKGPAR